MIITLMWNDEKNEIDIKVNREQRILDTLHILSDGEVLAGTEDIKYQRIFSKRMEQYIEINMTYEQAGIYNGDILLIQ